ncbi:hypothetical protein [Chryseobacterium sp. R2A-55]|uniref:hypothetical protein n=1 Tax=Chryseobacterium sp. R2A-55 TaxID=2744445 RepID=UPI001F353D26|nr:hypothetical protein [Chryseobacterium sp. R2A-55]
MKNFTEQAQDYFERHPSSEECHITSDGRVFHNNGGAQGFAGTLNDQTIESYNRKVFFAQKNTDDEAELAKLEAEKKAKEDAEAEKIAKENAEFLAEKTKLLQETDIEKAEYATLKDLAKAFEVKTEDQKAETLKTALIEFKNNLQKQ